MTIIIVLGTPFGVASIFAPGALSADPAPIDTYRSWIAAMKSADRGPFVRIRWFCADGSVLPPRPYACREHGGGVQHGEWTRNVKQMRADGFWVATVLADLDDREFSARDNMDMLFKQILLERFLIQADDGWIFRRARYYRGALQVEDETASAQRLLNRLARDTQWAARFFVVLREAARLLPHGQPDAVITEMRHLARSIESLDPGFHALRVKTHVQPEFDDAQRVHRYGQERGRPELADSYARLADLITQVYRPRKIAPQLKALASRMGQQAVAMKLARHAAGFDDAGPIQGRLALAADLLAQLRETLTAGAGIKDPLAVLDASLLLEDHLLRHLDAARRASTGFSRREQLQWLGLLTDVMYGMGFISSRQRKVVSGGLLSASDPAPTLAAYRQALRDYARAARWAEGTLRFHFSAAVDRLGEIEPLARLFVHDRLRSSPLMLYGAIVDRLQEDADALAGLGHRVLDASVGSGLQVLNPGLARGVLHVVQPRADLGDADPMGIYLLPETMDALPPVAGILTAGQGNPLSHVQLLARNLGIPNVVVGPGLLPRLRQMAGRRIFLAASPQGVVRLAADGPSWDRYFQTETGPSRLRIIPDLEKLDLAFRGLVSLADLRADDSGRIAGPKAANLAQLKQTFPEAVTEGLVIPFGEFRALLDRPLEPGGPTMFQWMQDQYRRLTDLDPGSESTRRETHKFLARVRQWIETADPGDDFRFRLGAALAMTFGSEGTYGVFVRSDTNVEDLPGFTGAGLNLTVPHVKGLGPIVAAISRVWASPFTERAHGWRQAHMDGPEHVYASVLLLKSVPVDKSGVMVTVDVDSGLPDHLTVAVNEGIGGAVAGQWAEELRIDLDSGGHRLVAQASEPLKRVLKDAGGLTRVPASGAEQVLLPVEIERLVSFTRALGRRMPDLILPDGRLRATDVEFGFLDQQLVLFQIRPFADNPRTRQDAYLAQLDRPLAQRGRQAVDLAAVPDTIEDGP